MKNVARDKKRFPIADIDAVIFDMDGVITDTARIHAAAWKRMFDEYLEQRAPKLGEPFRPFDIENDYLRYVDGKPRYDGVASFLESRGITLPWGSPENGPEQETVCGLGNRKDCYFMQSLKDEAVEPYRSSVEFIQTIKAQGIRTAVISASRNALEVLEAAGVTELIDARVDGLEASKLQLKGKPDPAIFLEAARRLGVRPERAVMFEDAQAGVEAGRRGGFRLVVGVDRTQHGGGLEKHGADLVVKDLSELDVAIPGSCEKDRRPPRDIFHLPSALERLDEIRRRLASRNPAVFLDYDGTLTPIVDRPEDALLADETKQVIKLLACYCPVAIVSGRDLADVRQMVGIDGIFYAGSHGFDITGPGGSHRDDQHGRRFLPALDRAEESLRSSPAPIPGARVERKRFAIAVHYRAVEQDRVGPLEEVVDRVVAGEPDLKKTGGKKVFELRPNMEWDKGKALLSLMETLGLSLRDTVPIFIGDDVTDEDAFRAIYDCGIGIVVAGDRRPTEAHYMLRDTLEVRRFMERLIDLMEDRGIS